MGAGSRHKLASSDGVRRGLFRRLSPFPLARLPVVAGDAALNHFIAPLIARYDESSETAAPEAKRTERRHKAEL
jgi:hypothetical protein